MRTKPIAGALLFGGTLIGAGILGLPYALAQGGFIGGLLILLAGAFFAYLSALYIGMLVYLDAREAPLSSIIESQMGKYYGTLVLISTFLSAYGALVAYPLAIGELLHSLAHIPFWLGSLLFLLFLLFLLRQGLGGSNKINAVITILLVAVLSWVMIKSISQIQPDHFATFHLSKIPQAWGVVIFAFAGHLVIPSVLHYVGAELNVGLRVLKWGLAGVAFLYGAFFLITLGVMGQEITAVATLGLGEHLSPAVSIAGQTFAIMAIVTSSFGIGISLKLTFENQFGLKPSYSLALIIIPVALMDLYLSQAGGDVFVKVLNFAGGVGSALYAGLIPALAALKMAGFRRIPFGTAGAYLSAVFYGLAVLYTLLRSL